MPDVRMVPMCQDCGEVLNPLSAHDHRCEKGRIADEVRAGENAVWEAKLDAVWNKWMDESGYAFEYAFPSVYSLPTDIAIKGSCFVRSEGDNGVYISRKLISPTWGDLLIEVEKSFHVTGDRHHTFLEDVSLTKMRKGGICVYNLDLGS